MKRGKEDSIDNLINSVLGQWGYTKKIKETEVIEAWKDVIGVSIANRTLKIYMSNGKLYVQVNSSIVKNELLMLKEGIRTALNNRVGEDIVKEVIIY